MAASSPAASSAPPSSVLAWLTTPSPSLSFAFLAGAYAVLSLLALAFAALQYLADVKAVAGMFIVPLPALLLLPYFVYMWRVQRGQRAAAEAERKDR